MIVVVLVRMIMVGMAMGCALALGQDIDFGAAEAASHYFAGFEARPNVEARSGALKEFKGDAGVYHGAEEHVAADTGKAVEVSNAHRL